MKSLVSIVVILFIVQSCVSISKYNDTLLHVEKLKADSALLAKRNRMLTDEKTYLETKGASMEQILTNRLQEKQDSIKNKEELLRQRELSIKDMKARKAEEREAFETLSKSVFELFNNINATDIYKHTNCTQIVVEVSDRLLFTSGTTKIDNSKASLILAKVAEAMQKNADLNVIVTGHTDSINYSKEKFDDNWSLGMMKSNNIVRALIKENKIPTYKISSSSKAESVSLTKQNLQLGKNRIEFVFYSSFLPCIHSKEE